MPNMYHPTLPNTYDVGVPVTLTAFKAVWEPNGWRLIDEDEVEDLAVDELIAAVATTQTTDEEE